MKKSQVMSAIELKEQIINKVKSISDESILEEIYKLINAEAEMESIYHLTNQERKGVEEGMADVRAGRVYTTQAAETKMREWLKK